jgi:hypothetical protein
VIKEFVEEIPEVFSVDGFNFSRAVLDKSFEAIDEDLPDLSQLIPFRFSQCRES